jgi:hypothetical protein
VLDSQEQGRIHRVIAERTLDAAQLDPILVDTAFRHALIARSHHALVKIAHCVVMASENDLEIIAPWMAGLRDTPIDRPIFPESLQLSYMLRLAQVLLLGAHGPENPVSAAITALFAEIDTEPDHKQRDRFTYIATTKLFLKQCLHGRIPRWFEKLLKLREISSRNPEMERQQRSLEHAHPQDPGVLGVLFTFQAMGLHTITELSELFDAFDDLSGEARSEILNLRFADRHGLLFIDGAWMREHRGRTINGADAAMRFQRMAHQAEGWGIRELAIRCHVARSIMIDEYQDRPDAALAALDEAAQRLGEDPLITRARAKIFYRRKDYAGALEQISSVGGDLALKNPVEKVFMLREAGISAAELGEWSRARTWYATAHDVAMTSSVPTMRPMALGLMADKAVAQLMSGDPVGALRSLGEALTALPALDPNASLPAYYCHSIVRHAILWALARLSKDELLVEGEPPQMRPGWCSNPEPSDAILEKPLAPLEAGWYLLARADLATGNRAGIAANLTAHLAGRTIVQMEIMLAQDQIESAICAADPERFAAHLRPWADARVYFRNNLAIAKTSAMEKPIYAGIPPASDAELRAPDTSDAIEQAVLAFAVAAAFKGRVELLDRLVTRLKENASADLFQGRIKQLLDVVADGDGPPSSIAAITRTIAASSADPNDLFVATVRFLQSVGGSLFASALGPMCSQWSKRAWRHAIENQRFLLRTPGVTVPTIEAALSAAGDDLTGIVQLVFAVEPAVSHRLSPELRAQLSSMN